MKTTPYAWWCCFGHRNGPYNRVCSECGCPRFEKHAQVHASERAVVYQHPITGERRTPARADAPMPDVYQQQGFERREILQMTQFEKETGLVHESSNFNCGSEPIPERYGVPEVSKESKQALIKDMADAIASGPWTDSSGLLRD